MNIASLKMYSKKNAFVFLQRHRIKNQLFMKYK